MNPKAKLALIAVGAVTVIFLVSSFGKNWGKVTAERDLNQAQKAAKACIANPQAAAKYCAQAAREIGAALPDLEKSEKKELAPRARKTLADVHLAMGQFDAAIAGYQQLVDLEPQQGNRHGDLARALSKANRHNEAMRAAQLAVQLSPTAWQAHRLNGQILSAAERHPEAIAAFEQAATLAPPDQQDAARKAIEKLKQKIAAATLTPNESLQTGAAATSNAPAPSNEP